MKFPFISEIKFLYIMKNLNYIINFIHGEDFSDKVYYYNWWGS